MVSPPRPDAGAVSGTAAAPGNVGVAAASNTAGPRAGADAGARSKQRKALQALDANSAANPRVRTSQQGQPRLLDDVATAQGGKGKVRGKGKPKTEAATAEQATGSLSDGLAKLHAANTNFARKGTVAGDAGKQHHVVAITVACIQGRIPNEGKNQGGRVSAERKRKASEDPPELFVLTYDPGMHRSNGELAGFLRATAAALEHSGSGGGADTTPVNRDTALSVNVVARNDGCPDVSTIDFVKKAHGAAQGTTAQDRMSAISHAEISSDLRGANPLRFGFGPNPRACGD